MSIDHARQEWLNYRMTAIGASEVPSIFGEGFETPYELWARKSGLIPATDETEAMEIGTLLQDDIAELLRRRTNLHIEESSQTEFHRCPDYQFIGCTLDAIAYDPDRDGPGCCEIKNVGHFPGREWETQVPLRVQIQIQTQMLATGCKWGIAAGFIGGNRMKWQFVDRDEKFIAWMVPHVVEFWRRIKDGDPPPVDGSAATRRVLATMHPNDNGESVFLPDEFESFAKQLDYHTAEAFKHEEEIERIRNMVRAAIGPNTFGLLPDGSGWSNKTVTRKAHQVAESTSRTLRRTKAKGN